MFIDLSIQLSHLSVSQISVHWPQVKFKKIFIEFTHFLIMITILAACPQISECFKIMFLLSCKIEVDSNFLLVLKIKCTKFHQDRSKTVDLHTKYTNKQTFIYIYI
jgi:hypothetical protein